VSAWQDAWTLLLTVPNVVTLPNRVTLEYDGPSENLRITWTKQWEPWGPIVSVELPPVYTSRTFSTGPDPSWSVDVSNVNILYIDCAANDIHIASLSGGVNDQLLHIVKLCDAANDVTLRHIGAGPGQLLYLHAGDNETLTGEYGGWTLACKNDCWYDISHAKHV